MMSDMIITRNESQCRSHHQKMLEYKKNIPKIIEELTNCYEPDTFSKKTQKYRVFIKSLLGNLDKYIRTIPLDSKNKKKNRLTSHSKPNCCSFINQEQNILKFDQYLINPINRQTKIQEEGDKIIKLQEKVNGQNFNVSHGRDNKLRLRQRNNYLKDDSFSGKLEQQNIWKEKNEQNLEKMKKLKRTRDQYEEDDFPSNFKPQIQEFSPWKTQNISIPIPLRHISSQESEDHSLPDVFQPLKEQLESLERQNNIYQSWIAYYQQVIQDLNIQIDFIKEKINFHSFN